MGVKHEFVEQWQAALNGDPEHDLAVTRIFVETASHGIGLDSSRNVLSTTGPFWWNWDRRHLKKQEWITLRDSRLGVFSSWWQLERHGWLNLAQPFQVWYSVPRWQTYEFVRQERMFYLAAANLGMELGWYNPTYSPLVVYEILTKELDWISQELAKNWAEKLPKTWELAFQAAYDYRQCAKCVIDHWQGQLYRPRSY